ncbi:Protein FLUORESCENT IN BLUE LIGHT, chloroplastic, partial [Tetrabaena socialis]
GLAPNLHSQAGKLCATPFGVDVVGITELIALIGALVGGVTARRRKDEVERLNEQLRSINLNLRQQARAGTVYAPGLSYAPPAIRGGLTMLPTRDIPVVAPVVAPAPPAAAVAVIEAASLPPKLASAPSASASASTPLNTLFSMEEEVELSNDQIQCKEALRAGKRMLKEKNGAAAMVRFEKALMLSKALADRVQERRAQRGLAASCRITHQYRQAIKHLECVLEISRAIGEYTGDADAYGTMADCYTDMGEFEKAAAFYDKYIERMNRDGPI